MPIAVHFSPKSMNQTQYNECLTHLRNQGAHKPAGRLHHICYGSGDALRVVDVWDTHQSFEAFGQILMPILQGIGVDPGAPQIDDVVQTIDQ